MRTIQSYMNDGTQSCGDASTLSAGRISTMARAALKFLTSFVTGSPLLTTARHSRATLKENSADSLLTASTTTETMKEETSGLQPFESKCEIYEGPNTLCGKEKNGMREHGLRRTVKTTVRVLLSGLLRTELTLLRYLKKMQQTSTSGGGGKKEPVYDLVNCGPRHRFCTPFNVLHNCLGLGYGCGYKKFVTVAKILAGLDITEEESYDTVQSYRRDNPKITKFWYHLDDMVNTAARRKKPSFDVKLPSGRVLKYWSPRYRTVKREKSDGTTEIRNELFSMELYNWPSSYRKTYGAKITENICQAVARDILRDSWLALDQAGYQVLFTVHDEFVIEMKDGQTLEEAERIIKTPEPWAEFVPLDVEGKVSPVFTK